MEERLSEYIYAFMYRQKPGGSIKIGSVWATSAKEAAKLAANALATAYPDHVKGRLYRAGDPRENRTMLPVDDPNTGEGLTPSQVRAKEDERCGV